MLIVNEHDTLYFENYANFTEMPLKEITDELIKKDCFYGLMKTLSKDDLNSLFGWMFMETTDWIDTYV